MTSQTEFPTAQIRLLSDGILYREAIDLTRRYDLLDNAQVSAMLARLHTWAEITGFANRQKERDWSVQHSKSHYLNFYSDLVAYLNQLPTRIKTEFQLAPDGLTSKAEKAWLQECALLLAREFFQHLAAEMAWRRKNL